LRGGGAAYGVCVDGIAAFAVHGVTIGGAAYGPACIAGTNPRGNTTPGGGGPPPTGPDGAGFICVNVCRRPWRGRAGGGPGIGAGAGAGAGPGASRIAACCRYAAYCRCTSGIITDGAAVWCACPCAGG
jgi:hypothetical protein